MFADWTNWIDSALVAALAGGGFGAVITTWWNLRKTGNREKESLTLRLIERYLEKTNERAKVHWLLKNVESITPLSIFTVGPSHLIDII